MTVKNTLNIKTGVSYFTAVFERVYVLETIKSGEDFSIINFKSYDKVPSGYVDGGSDQLLAKNLKVKFKSDNINKNIANLALKLDTSLNKKTGCNYSNNSKDAIIKNLKEISKSKESILEI